MPRAHTVLPNQVYTSGAFRIALTATKRVMFVVVLSSKSDITHVVVGSGNTKEPDR